MVRHADLVEVTRRPGDFLSGKGITFESIPPELLSDAAQGFIAMDPLRHTKIRRLVAAFTPSSLPGSTVRSSRTPGASLTTSPTKAGRLRHRGRGAGADAQHLRHDRYSRGAPPDRRHESQFADGWRDPRLLQGAEPLARVAQTIHTVRAIADRLIADRRRNPGDDLLSSLVQAEGGR